jgi:hypothetical protein
MIASAVSRNLTGFDLDLAYEAVKKNADVPPVNDATTQFVFALPPLIWLPLLILLLLLLVFYLGMPTAKNGLTKKSERV